MALVSVSAAVDELRPPFHPVRMRTVELTRPLPALAGGRTRQGVPYGTTRTLVTLHDEPLGLLDHDLSGGRIPASALAHAIYAELGGSIERHLREDGLDTRWDLGPEGLSTPVEAPCRPSDGAAGSSVTVVLSTTCAGEGLERSLDSLLASDHLRFEVMVVDRDAPGPSVSALVDRRRQTDPRVRYLAAHGQSRSAARNAAFGLSRGEVVAFTDEGCVASSGWIRAVAAAFERHAGAACVVGPVLGLELETPPQLAFEAATSVTGGWSRRVMHRAGSAEGPVERPFLASVYGSGDNIAVQKRLLDDLWGFDPHLGPGSPAGAADDLDVLIGALAEGHQVVFEPRALVWRRHPADVATVRERLRDREVALGAMLTKQMLVGRLPRREVLQRVAEVSASAEQAATGTQVAHLASGLVAYARSRVKNSWATA